MTRLAERIQLAAALSALAGAAALGLAGRPAATAADPGLEYLGKGPTRETAGDLSAGIAGCQACHNGADTGQAAGYVKSHRSNEFVLLDESATWVRDDVHSRALAALDGPLGREMGRVLGRGAAGYTVTEDVRCLTCHSADKSPAKPLAEKRPADFAAAVGGVNCTVCHGMHERWQFDHTKEPDRRGEPLPWRSKTPADKWERGMSDLRNPVVKARLCVSCHVGNAAEGKVVTHEMYAAGHPPLPPFELASFLEGEPKHWAYPTDPRLKFFATVPAADRWRLFHFHPAADESYLARHYAAGAVAALRAEAELLRADAGAAAAGGDGIDFARFDCLACHHDLKSPSDRQKRGYDGPPGRPPLRAAAGVPAGLVARHAEGVAAGGLGDRAKGFDAGWAALRKAATDRPFGHPARVRDAARAVADWCDGFLKVQGECPTPLYPPDQAKRLRAMIAGAAAGPAAADPEAALSLAWGYRTLAREVGTEFPPDRLAKLGAVVPLNVREEPYSEKGPGGGPVGARYERRMGMVNAFDAGLFREAMKGLGPEK